MTGFKQLLLAGLLTLGWGSIAWGQQNPPPVASPAIEPTGGYNDLGNSLTVLTSAGVEPVLRRGKPVPSRAVHNFGDINPIDTAQVEQTFQIRNDSKVDVTLAHLAPSCACTTVAIVAQGKETAATDAALPTLHPGQQIALHVKVNTQDEIPGSVVKSIYVYGKGHEKPIAQLRMSGYVVPTVTFTPALLDFGTVSAGEARSRLLTVTLDSRLEKNGVPPPLLSTNPDVQIIPQAAPVSAPGAKAGKPVPATQSHFTTVTYALTVSRSASLGSLRGGLFFLAPSSASSQTSAAPDASLNNAAALDGATALLSGEVVGAVAAQPQAVAFGTVRLGQPAVRQIVLNGQTALDMDSLKVACASLYFSAKVNPLAPVLGGAQASPTSRVLEVSLRGDAPPGVLQSQLKVRLTNGQRLVIPVSAFVSQTARY